MKFEKRIIRLEQFGPAWRLYPKPLHSAQSTPPQRNQAYVASGFRTGSFPVQVIYNALLLRSAEWFRTNFDSPAWHVLDDTH